MTQRQYFDSANVVCKCGKTASDQNHYVWIAFLSYENEEFQKEEWCTNYFCFSINKLATWWTESDIIHCQIAFQDNTPGNYITYSVDSVTGEVWCEQRDFSKEGWRFARIRVTMDQENRIRKFLQAQLGKPFNSCGINMFWLCPWSGGGEKWFCSELTMAALQRAGLYKGYTPAECGPSKIYDIVTSDRNLYVPDAHIIRVKNTTDMQF